MCYTEYIELHLYRFLVLQQIYGDSVRWGLTWDLSTRNVVVFFWDQRMRRH